MARFASIVIDLQRWYLGYRLTVALMMISVWMIVSCSHDFEQPKPRVAAGVLDAREYDFESRGPGELSGDWQFMWSQFADPAVKTENAISSIYITVPNSWNGETIQAVPQPGVTVPSQSRYNT